MPINKIDMTDPIEPLSSIYNLGWWMTNYTNTSAPELPAGFVINIQGVAYIVEGGNVLPSGSPSDGAVYVKITPDGPSGDTATAEFTNTFSGTWSDAYNCWCDGSTIYLNIFMTKATTSYSDKGFWLNWRTRQSKVIAENVDIDGDLTAVNGIFSGDVSGVNGNFSGDVSGVNGTFSGDVSGSSINITGAIETHNRITPNHIHGRYTVAQITTALLAFLTVDGQEAILCGNYTTVGSGVFYTVSYCRRISSSTIRIYGAGNSVDFTTASSTQQDITVSW